MIDIKATTSSPRISFHPNTHVLEIVGESYPENSFEFFAPLFEWLNAEVGKLDRLRLDVNISYMNSSSTKCMLDVLDFLEEASRNGCDISIRWFYDAENERALDLAEEFKEDFTIPFEIVPLDQENPS